MASSAQRPAVGPNSRSAAPKRAVLPPLLDPAELPVHDLDSDATRSGLAFAGLDLAERSASFAEIRQCRFTDADLHGTTLDRATVADCVIQRSDLATLRARRSSMTRTELSVLRMTGFHWTDGPLRDVRFDDCRIDLSSFRFATLTRVVFDRCNLTGADFSNADLRGAHFTGCDLAGAQFAHATMDGTRFTDCGLAAVGGVTSWRGAIVRSHDLVALAHSLAAALGIQVDSGH